MQIAKTSAVTSCSEAKQAVGGGSAVPARGSSICTSSDVVHFTGARTAASGLVSAAGGDALGWSRRHYPVPL